MKTQGEIEAAVCDGMTRFEQEYMGRGPKDIHTHLIGDLLVVRLQGVLTAAEQQLVKALPAEKGRDLLKQVRHHLLETARPLAAGRLITVFGCGGDRDRTKRPLMGAVAGRLSDLIVVTSDNPRSEDPKAIIKEIEKGMKGARYLVVVDRREAIRAALLEAEEGDTVVLAGKGHETYQTIGTTSHPFDDRAVARELLHELNPGRN